MRVSPTLSGAPYGPDGTSDITNNACCPRASIANPIGTFSGYDTTDFTGALVGLFLEELYLAQHRPVLHWRWFDGHRKRNRPDFSVPATATHLYLGYVDSCSSSGKTSPGCYTDNGGAIAAVFRLYQTSK
jgi:hypothetical protein